MRVLKGKQVKKYLPADQHYEFELKWHQLFPWTQKVIVSELPQKPLMREAERHFEREALDRPPKLLYRKGLPDLLGPTWT